MIFCLIFSFFIIFHHLPMKAEANSPIGTLSICYGTIIKYNSAGEEQWVAYLPAGPNEKRNATNIFIAESGGVLIDFVRYKGAYLNDALLRLDENGNLVWEQMLGIYSVVESILDPFGNWIHLTHDSLVKHDQDGNELLNRDMRASNRKPLYDLKADPDGNIYLTGRLQETKDPGFVTQKRGANGKLLWEQKYNYSSTSIDEGEAIGVDGAGNVYSSGRYRDSEGEEYKASDIVIKYDAEGTLLWVTETHPAGGALSDILVDEEGNAYISDTLNTSDEYTSTKLSPDGKKIFSKVFGNSSCYCEMRSINPKLLFLPNGNILVMAKERDKTGHSDYLLHTYSPDGTLVWEWQFNGNLKRNDIPRDIATDEAGNVYITGGVNVETDVVWDVVHTAGTIATFAFDQTGQELWSAQYNDPEYNVNFGESIAVDKNGNVYVSGQSCRVVYPIYPDDDAEDDDDDAEGDDESDDEEKEESCGC